MHKHCSLGKHAVLSHNDACIVGTVEPVRWPAAVSTIDLTDGEVELRRYNCFVRAVDRSLIAMGRADLCGDSRPLGTVDLVGTVDPTVNGVSGAPSRR